jgi:GlpG protein
MLWLVLLSKQMEERLRPLQYIGFILITGIFSNTCQYLMSGPNFVGFSGVLCAMVAFIWMRQKIAPWEGYPLQKSTITFLAFFVAAMLGIQIFAFYWDTQHISTIAPGIANTAHISGALIGAILGRLSLFSWKT